jgi:hypothetical protein
MILALSTWLALDDADRRLLESLKDIPEDHISDSDFEDVDDAGNIHDIDSWLDGSEATPLSHAGGEFQQILDEELLKTRRVDSRTRRNIIELRTAGFNAQMEDMVRAYILWSEALGDGGMGVDIPPSAEGSVEGSYKIYVVDVFSEFGCSCVFPQLTRI